MKTKRKFSEILEMILSSMGVFFLLVICGIFVWLVISVLFHAVKMAANGEWPLYAFIGLALFAIAVHLANKYIPCDESEEAEL